MHVQACINPNTRSCMQTTMCTCSCSALSRIRQVYVCRCATTCENLHACMSTRMNLIERYRLKESPQTRKPLDSGLCLCLKSYKDSPTIQGNSQSRGFGGSERYGLQMQMYMCTCVYMYICIYVCIYICIYVYMYISIGNGCMHTDYAYCLACDVPF